MTVGVIAGGVNVLAQRSLQRVFLLDDGVVQLLRGLRRQQSLAEFLNRHESADSGQGVDVGAGFVRGGGEQPDKRDRASVDGLKINGGSGTTDRHDQVVRPV